MLVNGFLVALNFGNQIRYLLIAFLKKSRVICFNPLVSCIGKGLYLTINVGEQLEYVETVSLDKFYGGFNLGLKFSICAIVKFIYNLFLWFSLLLLRLRICFSFLNLYNRAILEEFLHKPIYEFLFLEFLAKQLIEVVIEDVCEGFGIEAQILPKLLPCIADIVLDKLINQLVVFHHPRSGTTLLLPSVARGLLCRQRSCSRIFLSYAIFYGHFNSF